jgi:hypothetical protein
VNVVRLKTRDILSVLKREALRLNVPYSSPLRLYMLDVYIDTVNHDGIRVVSLIMTHLVFTEAVGFLRPVYHL